MVFGGVNNPGLDFDGFTSAEKAALIELGSLGDPNANAIVGWDDTDNAYKYFLLGSGLTYTHSTHTLSASGGGGGTPGGLNTQVQYNNAGSFGGVSGATTDGTILSLTNPVIGGSTITTSTVNGVTLVTGGTSTLYLSQGGTYTAPAGTYTLPTASTSILGGVKIDGTSITISGGVISATTGGTGTVTTVSVASANGFTGTVANATTTPAITIIAGAITPTSVNSVVFSGSSTPTLAVTGTSSISGSNTGDQTITLTGAVTGSGTGSFATTLATPGTLTVATTNSNVTAHTHAVTSSSAPGAAASLLATDSSGIVGSTGTRIVKIWATDLTVTNAIAGSITGNSATATALATGRTISISGDLAYTSPSFDGTGNVTAAGTLATVNTNVGSFTYASITVNGKGLITAASNGTAPLTNPMTTLGDIIYENVTPAATRLAGNTTTTKNFLTQTGTGTVSAAPVWGTIASGDVPTLNQNTTGSAATLTTPRAINGVNFDGSAAITVTAAAGTLTGTTLNSTVVTSSLTSVGTITTGVWTGTTIAIANGGTGQTSKAAAFDALSPMSASGDIIYGGASGTGTRLAKGSDTQVLTLASGLPTWASPSAAFITSVTSPLVVTTGNLTINQSTTSTAGYLSFGDWNTFNNKVGTSTTDSLTNKTLTGSTNTVTLLDTKFTLQDDGDTSKQLVFQLSGITTATTRTLTIPDASGTIALTSGVVTSFNSRTGAVTPGSSDYTTSQIAEGSNLYFTSAKAVTAATAGVSQLSLLTSNGIVTTSSGNGTLSVTATTGSGSVVLATSPTLTTPVIASIVNTGTLTLPTSSDTLVGRATTDTLTNKRVTKRAPTVTQSATPTINTDNTDVAHITGLAQAITSFTTNLTGTPVEGDTLRIDILDNGTARAISWGLKFEASTVALPTTTVINTRLDIGFIWNTSTTKWRCVAVA